MTFTCGECKQEKDESDFYRYSYGRMKGHVRFPCRQCFKAASRRRNREESVRQAARAASLRKSYGVSLEQYETMLKAQGGICAICGSEDDPRAAKSRLHVDHDHGTGKVRALLCHNCNHGLGHFKDSQAFLLKAAAYLQSFSTETT